MKPWLVILIAIGAFVLLRPVLAVLLGLVAALTQLAIAGITLAVLAAVVIFIIGLVKRGGRIGPV